ncbi:heme exporter protein CcmD [Ottowia testudinis]
MGKHGAYVWPAFGVCALALSLEWWALSQRAHVLRAGQPLTPTPGSSPGQAFSPEERGSEKPRAGITPSPSGRGRGEGHAP